MFQSRHITKFFVHQISATHWSTSKNLWMPWTFHRPIQLPFFVRPLHARCILERQTPVRWWWWRRFRIRKLWVIYIYIYIFWKNLEKKAYSNCPSFFSHWKIYRLKGTVCCWQNMTKPSCTLQQIRPPRRHMSIKSISQMALLNTGDWISLMCKSEFPTIINPCKNLRYPGKHTSA